MSFDPEPPQNNEQSSTGNTNGYTVTVTGATGKTGTHVAALAARRGWRVRTAGRRKPPHWEWTKLDWGDTSTWRSAFTGSHAAYIVIPFNHPMVPQHAPDLLEAAADAKVGSIVLLSSLDTDDAPADSPLHTAERTLRALPVRWTVIRPTWFMDNFTTGSFAEMISAGTLRLPAGDARIPFVDVRDVAAVAVAALADNGPEGLLPVTGPQALTHHEVAAALGKALGRQIDYISVSSHEFVTTLIAQGFPPDYASFLAQALSRVAEGRKRITVTDTVQRVTGRRPHSISEFAHHYAAHRADL